MPRGAGTIGRYGRLVRRLGLGPAYLATTGLACAAMLLIPLRGEPGPFAVILVAAGLALSGFGVSSSSVYAVTLRQSVVPDQLLGRVMAAYRLVSYGSIPLAGVVAGVLGSTIGVRVATAVSAVALLTAPLPLFVAPIRGLRTVADAATLASGGTQPGTEPVPSSR